MTKQKSIWVFGDYRNYFQNRVTLQLLSKAVDLAGVIGATDFGREFAPRLAKRLQTGLSADCVGLDITPEGLLIQTAPSFGGNMLAEIVTEMHRPQMATVRPGIFKEIPHDYERTAIVERLPLPSGLPVPRARVIEYERAVQREHTIENATVIVCGGRGMGNKNNFKRLSELAGLLGGDVGATRPVVYAGWAGHNALVGQAGKHIKPKILFSFGISGAIQHTAGLGEANFIVAVNKNPQATMMKMADVAVTADAGDFLNNLIRELKKRIRD